MSKLKLEGKALHDVHQLVYLANEYPDKKMMDLGQLFQLTMLDMNVAFWRAEELGYLLINEKTGECKVKTVPKEWDFGPAMNGLEESIMFAIKTLATREQDYPEEQLMQWLMGEPAQHTLVAMKHLLNTKRLTSYKVINKTELKPSKKGLKRGKKTKIVEDTYLFYTLPGNESKRWGEKQFTDVSRLS